MPEAKAVGLRIQRFPEAEAVGLRIRSPAG